MTKKLLPICLLSVLGLVACSPEATCPTIQAEEESPQSPTFVSQTDMEDCLLPEGTTTRPYKKEALDQDEDSPFLQKVAFDGLMRGMTVNLDDYVEVRPIDGQEGQATYKAYVLTGEQTTSSGYIVNGNGMSHQLVLTDPGIVYLNLVRSDGAGKTYVLQVGESYAFVDFQNALLKVGDNYHVSHYSYDSSTSTRSLSLDGYRGRNYIYDAIAGSGMLLSTLDDSIYDFLLDSPEGTLDVQVPPISSKAAWNSLFRKLSTFADASSWVSTKLLSSDVRLSKYNLMFQGSSDEISAFFCSLYYLNTYYLSGSTPYYPYTILGCYQNGTLSFLPLLMDSNGTSLAFLPEVEITQAGLVQIDSLDSYIDSFQAPEKTDVTELVENIEYLTEVFDYTVSCDSRVYDSEGNAVPRSNPYVSAYFSRLYYSPWHYVTETTYYDDNFHGIYPEVKPGGLYTKNSRTFEFMDEDGDGMCETVYEYIQAGDDASSPVWWGYDNIRGFLSGYAYPTSDLKNGYAQYDPVEDSYTYSGRLSSGASLIEGALVFGYTTSILNDSTIRSLIPTDYATCTFTFEYDEDGQLTALHNTVEITYPQSILPALDQDYTWRLEITVDDIGTTAPKAEKVLEDNDVIAKVDSLLGLSQ